MVKVFKDTDYEYYMDGYLKAAFDIAKKKIKADWDFVFVYDGMEGSGKSVKAMQDAFYCDQTLNYGRYAFNADQFKRAIRVAKQYQAVVYDEAHSGLNSRAAMSTINRSLVSMLTEIRQKNLFVFVLLPTYFDLDKYVALWRSRALIHIYTDDDFNRGYFAFWNVDRKKQLYVKGKKFYSYGGVKPNFIGRFTNHYPLDEAEYRRLKAASLMKRDDARHDEELRTMADRLFEDRVLQAVTMKPKQKQEVLQMSKDTYYNRLRRLKASTA